MANLFIDLAQVRERFAFVARQAEELMLGEARRGDEVEFVRDADVSVMNEVMEAMSTGLAA